MSSFEQFYALPFSSKSSFQKWWHDTWQHNEHFSHYNTERQCVAIWSIKSPRKCVRECGYRMLIQNNLSNDLDKVKTAMEKFSMWHLQISFFYSPLVNWHFQTALNPHPVPEFLAWFFSSNCLQLYMSYYQKWVKCERWSDISTKSLMSKLKCCQVTQVSCTKMAWVILVRQWI